MEITKLTIKHASKFLKEKKISAEDLTKAILENIDQNEQKINAFITLEGDLALKQAQVCDKRASSGKRLSEIDGIPLAIKDNILIKGLPCTAGSKILENFIASYDATVIKKLKNAGVVFLGKTNLDEFAMGSSTETSYFGPTKNPSNLERVPGGSSGGSAAAVTSDMCLGALGSDTGGSIRQPASFCGVVGLKPTYGAVSRYGLIAMASSLDQIGPITKSVEDAQILFNIISDYDPLDSTSVKKNQKSKCKMQNENPKLKNMKIGIIDTEPTDESKKVYNQTIKKLGNFFKNVEKTKELNEVLDIALACYYIIMFAEVSSNLARYDGIKYGYSKISNLPTKGGSASGGKSPAYANPLRQRVSVARASAGKQSSNLLEVYLQSRAEGFGTEAKRRIMLGTYVLSAGYYEAFYKSALKARAKIRKVFEKIFQKYDLLVLPTSPTLPFKIGEKINDPLTMYLSDIYTVPVNIAGLPAISIPVGQVNNLPVGLQIIGPHWHEEQIFQLGMFIEEIR